MARLAAGVVSAVVVLIVLGVGVTPGKGDLVGDLFDGVDGGLTLSYFRQFPTMRIVSSRSGDLSLAVLGGTVVLAKTDFNDLSQAWIVDDKAIGKLSTEDGCQSVFALVNLDKSSSRLQAIIPPKNNPRDPAALDNYDPHSCVRPSMLWTKGTPDQFGNYPILMFGDQSRGFNSLGGAFEGATLGVRPTDGTNANVLWKIVDFNSS